MKQILPLFHVVNSTFYYKLKKSDLKDFSNHEIGNELQVLFVCSGCEYVSFQKHYTKVNFYEAHFNNVKFISADNTFSGSLSLTGQHDWQQGFLAFCRIIG